jgi:hypothetical protein
MEIPIHNELDKFKAENQSLLLALGESITKEESAEKKGFWRGVAACVVTLAFFFAMAFIVGWINGG